MNHVVHVMRDYFVDAVQPGAKGGDSRQGHGLQMDHRAMYGDGGLLCMVCRRIM